MKPIRPITHEQVVKKLSREPGFRRSYEAELKKLRLADAVRTLRRRRGLTQAALAKRLGVSQPLIARIERAEAHNFTLDTLMRIVSTLNGELTISIKSAK